MAYGNPGPQETGETHSEGMHEEGGGVLHVSPDMLPKGMKRSWEEDFRKEMSPRNSGEEATPMGGGGY